MPTYYEVWICDAIGNKLDVVDDYISFQYTRSLNQIGTLILTLRGDYDQSLLKLDGRVAIWRTISGKTYLDTETVWLIRKTKKEVNDDGEKFVVVTGVSTNEIIKRRIVDYISTSGCAVAASAYSDDLMKNIMHWNFGACSNFSVRNISTYLSVQALCSQGPKISKSFSNKNVLLTFQEICQTTMEDGSPVYFDVVSPTVSTMEFRTYRDARGFDHTWTKGVLPVILSNERGNMSSVFQEYNRLDECTRGIGIGPAEEADRHRYRYNSIRANDSPLNLREVAGYTTSESVSDTRAEAWATLREGRPYRVFEGKVADTPACTYGIHWGWGDKVTAELDGESIDCVVETVQVSMSKGEENIEVTLRVDEQYGEAYA